ncbi:long-chain-fatty-acid--CoA ligase [Halorhodospira halochloris]|uniref:Long-chain-fatty-acid--CoA ligase n=1 Tax=Halorhodospira halochloris TaxID=1052 RepID=A0A110B509_HALHR|nr:AMP-binding protein [Halorhodospira halochloris]MBK1651258.1 long-chain fatty acid--CoA ligase [Halorhodospira halochloris]BAU57536.1 long-chain-fatty-acid--CoA ligase [Halorhodospira halochloris]
MAAQQLCYDNLPMDWVGNWSGRRADLTPHSYAIYEPITDRRLTYRQMDLRAELAGKLLSEQLQLAPGDPICLLSRNRLEAIDLYFACGKTGVVLAPLSYRLAEPELNDLVKRIAPRVLFYDEAFADQAAALHLPPGCEAIELADEGEGVYRTALQAAEDDSLIEAAEQDLFTHPAGTVNRPLCLSDPFLYVHTGGTTSKPKICVISHRQMVWNAVDILASSGGALGPQRELLTFPLFHIGGWNTLTPVYYAGGFTVLLRSFDPGDALELIENEQISHFGAVEAMLQMMTEDPAFASTDLSSLESVTTAGAPCSATTMQPLWDRGVPVSQSYGLTEGGPSNFLYVQEDQSLEEIRERYDSVGKAMFHTDYRIVDPHSLEPVNGDSPGVLLLRSPHNFDGYLDDPQRDELMLLEGGWVYSGDLAYADEQGYVRIVGRVDNVFISGGENVSPEEVEEVLVRHAGIDKAAVVGVDDSRWGKVPVAAIVSRPGADIDEEQIRSYARRELAAFKVPRQIRFVDDLPLTGAGKIDRQKIRNDFFAED